MSIPGQSASQYGLEIRQYSPYQHRCHITLMEDIAKAILTQLKSVSQKYGYEARVHEHDSSINQALDISYMIASKQDIDATQQLIWTIPVTSPNLVRITCIQVFTTNGTQPHSMTTMYDLDISKPDFFSSAEDIFILYA